MYFHEYKQLWIQKVGVLAVKRYGIQVVSRLFRSVLKSGSWYEWVQGAQVGSRKMFWCPPPPLSAQSLNELDYSR